MGEPFAELREVSKSYGTVRALDEVNIRLRRGEVHCLAGENGAGKSTLIKVLTGAESRDAGTYRIEGVDIGSLDPAAARKQGVGAVYQDLSLLPHLSVGENLLLAELPARWWILERRRLTQRAQERLDRVGLGDLDPATPVAELPTATRQMVEIAKVLGQSAQLVILDEPTTALSENDATELLERIRQLRREGVAVLYVSHRLEEMLDIGDQLTVLRDGAVSTTGPSSSFDEERLITAMVGRSIDSLYPDYPEHERTGGDPLLSVRELRRPGASATLNLQLDAGEVLGVAGLLGSGRTELLRAIFGADSVEEGTVEIAGRSVGTGDPAAAVRAGLGLLTEDRKELGLLPQLSIRYNVAIANLLRISSRGLVSSGGTARAVDHVLESLRLRAGSYDDPVSTLSGGNQQKVLVARWLVSDAKVLLFDEPTKGIDIGAKGDLYTLIRDLARQGLGLIVVSSYLPELLGICDRIVVMAEGAIAGEVDASTGTEHDILRLASRHGFADSPAAGTEITDTQPRQGMH